VHGWQAAAPLTALELGQRMTALGLTWCIFTDVARDGLQSGLNIAATLRLAESTGLHVIASGGVRDDNDLQAARDAGLPGVIVGPALYEGHIQLRNWVSPD